jgi:protein involved in polysaccharide export with SLBB domain
VRGFLSVLTLSLVSLLAGAGTCSPAPDAPVVIEAEDREKTLVLGPSDVIEVRIYGETDLSGEHQVGVEGEVRLPLVGNVAIAGLSPDEAQRTIEEAYNRSYLKDAQVSVLVKAYNSRRIYVLGQVKSPGNYEYEPRMTVIAAIARAGGASKLANANGTVITRGKDENQTRLSAPVNDIQRGEAPDIELLPGDIVFVPESPF